MTGMKVSPPHRDKSSKLDKYYELIKQKLLIKGTSVQAVYEFIISEIDTDIGTSSNFRKYVTRKGLVPKKSEKGHPRFETAPGHQAQVDWKEDLFIANKYGEIFTFQVFDYKLVSGYRYTTYASFPKRKGIPTAPS